MKFIFTLLICLCVTFNLLSQSIDYPKFEIDSLGQKVVVMTIEQAQALDNSTDLIPLFNQLNVQVGGVDSVSIRVINEKDIVIAKQQVEIAQQKSLLLVKDSEITNLKAQITDYKNNETLYKQELSNKDAEIKLHLGKIRSLKTKMILGGSLGGLVVIGLILGILSQP